MSSFEPRVPVSRGATVIAVASGKGGVGKTSVVVNVALSLARMQRRVVVVDGDFSLGNVDVHLGLTPEYHAGHLLDGERTLDEVLIEGPDGIHVLPAASGLRELATLNHEQHLELATTLARLRRTYEFILIDTATGISDTVIDTLVMAHRVLLVTSTDPSAIVDAYATAKVLAPAAPRSDVGVVLNNVPHADEAALAFEQLDAAARRFLQQPLRSYGYIPRDPAVQAAIAAQRAVVEFDPHSDASRAFRILATRLAGLGPAHGQGLRLARGEFHHEAASEVTQCA
jgi:flagellar biosynthesis protein FlhG